LQTFNDIKHGVWAAAAGTSQPVLGFTPVWSVSNTQINSLGVADINPWKTIPGYGTVLWGDVTLNPVADNEGTHYLSIKRLLDMISLQASASLTPYVFFANDSQTWNEVAGTLQAYLRVLWMEGAIIGSDPTQAFQVMVGLGSTMTKADIEKGLMIVSLNVAPESPAEFTTLTVQQKMPVTPLPAVALSSNAH
jgi:hypothetical protein